jgi:hypothetical protein
MVFNVHPKIQKRWILILSIFIVLCVSVIVFIVTPRDPVTASTEVHEAVNFSVVIPSSLPKGFSVSSEPTYDHEKEVVITELRNADEAKLVLSQQTKPDVDLKQVDAKETYLIPAGAVYILKGEPKRIQAIVETDDSWIMVNCDQSIGIVACKSVISNLTAKN